LGKSLIQQSKKQDFVAPITSLKKPLLHFREECISGRYPGCLGVNHGLWVICEACIICHVIILAILIEDTMKRIIGIFVLAAAIMTMTASTCGPSGGPPTTPPSIPNPPSVTKCADLTAKGATECEKTNAIDGKTCSFEADACVEFAGVIKDFRSADMNFDVTLPAAVDVKNRATDKTLGTDHGEAPDWNALCGIKGAKRHELEEAVGTMSLEFAKDHKAVKVILDCNRGGGGKKSYDLGYGAKELPNDALLITIDLKGQAVNGDMDRPGRTGNLLEFFSKANVLYSKKKNAIIFISQLGNLGHRIGNPILPLKEEKEFDDAINYARTTGGGYEIASENGKNVGAISLILDKR
jgi:hypothetical protein